MVQQPKRELSSANSEDTASPSPSPQSRRIPPDSVPKEHWSSIMEVPLTLFVAQEQPAELSSSRSLQWI